MFPCLLPLALTLALPPAPQGDLGLHPGSGTSFIKEAHQSGQAAELGIVEIFWGRLVDVADAAGVVRFEDLLIGPEIASNGVTFSLDKNAVTQLETLTILHPFDSRGFRQALRQTQAGLVPLLDKGVGPNVLPPFTMMPRNSAFAVHFNDLLDDGGEPSAPSWPGTVRPENLRMFVGTPAQVPYGARVFPDPSHGNLRGDEFHSTRALIAFATSPLQAAPLGYPVNPLGLPASTSTTQANVLLRIATVLSSAAGQFQILTNLSGNGVGFASNGSNDPLSPTLDVVRSFRSGGETAVTGDPHNGFLPDSIAPQVLGDQPVLITAIRETDDGLALDLQFQTTACAFTPRVGDLVQATTQIYEVTADGAPPAGGLVQGVRVRVLFGPVPPVPPAPSPAVYTTVWDSSAGALPDCFVRYSPGAQSPPSAGVDVNADIEVRFSEPMQPNSVDPFDAFSLRYGVNPAGANPLYESVVGAVVPSADAANFAFRPSLPLASDGDASTADSYTVLLQGGPLGPRDLVGNTLASSLPPVTFTLSSSAPAVDSKSLALRFSSVDEDGNGAPEIRGQFLYDFSQGILRPRPVTRFSSQVDPVQHLTSGAMVTVPFPVQTPLSPYGSKLMSVWRYHDLGFGLRDDWTHNLDVEGLWWEPFGGTVIQDSFDVFEMSMAHSAWTPDEAVDGGLLPKYSNSGLRKEYAQNLADAPVVVHPKHLGYDVSPIDIELSPIGRALAPWPMNRNLPTSQYTRFLWRDTASLIKGGADGAGVDPWRLLQLTLGVAQPGFYPEGEVPTIGLPLLMEFGTYPTNLANGLNGFQVAIAINSSARPYFRSFSTGGVLASGQVKLVDPDLESSATGGINPVNGQATQGANNSVNYGQVDFVVRVSRLHTIWFDTLGVSQFAPATLIPSASRQPAGTQVLLAYRGAAALGSVNSSTWEDATNLDPYGNSYTGAQHCQLVGSQSSGCSAAMKEFFPVYFPGALDDTWTNNISDLDGASWIQVRVTLIANPDTGEEPHVSALGLAFLQ